MKPVFATLRSAGHLSVAYTDDSLLMSENKHDCLTNINDTVNFLSNLCFTINYEKSVLMPNQSIKFLGFLINSTSMNIRPTPDKIDKVIALANSILSNKTCTVYSPASFIGV